MAKNYALALKNPTTSTTTEENLLAEAENSLALN